MKLKATFLLAFLILGQFFSCLFSTQKLWPFNPILVFVEPLEDELSQTRFVAFEGTRETDVSELGWVDRRIRGRLAKAVEEENTRAERDQTLREIARRFCTGKGQDGVRIYHDTWSLSRGEVTETRLLAEVVF